MCVVGKQLEHQLVGSREVGGIAGERYPAEWSFALAEERSNILGDKARNVERVSNTVVESDSANVVSVVESDGSALLHCEHCFHVLDDRGIGTFDILVGVSFAKLRRGL